MHRQVDAILDEKVPLYAAALGDPGCFADRARYSGAHAPHTGE